MKPKLERCCKCHTSKAILKVFYFYGKESYICLDCERATDHATRNMRKYIIPEFLKN